MLWRLAPPKIHIGFAANAAKEIHPVFAASAAKTNNTSFLRPMPQKSIYFVAVLQAGTGKNDMQHAFLTGTHLYLRGLQATDAAGPYLNWLNDPEVGRYLETRYQPWSQARLERYLAQLDGSQQEFLFGICLRTGDRHIGNIKLGPVNWIHRFADIGLLIGEKDQWGKGYASEAIGLVCDFAFGTLNLHKLKAGCYADNQGSARAFLRNGFVEEGRLRQQWLIDNQYQDSLLLGLLRDDYYRGRNTQP
jgi:ribosomal-protein-alanine N-acetyltransferase